MKRNRKGSACIVLGTLLLLAALTSSISMHEICTAFIHEKYGLGRRVAAWIVTLACLLGGAACSLSFGVWHGLFRPL